MGLCARHMCAWSEASALLQSVFLCYLQLLMLNLTFVGPRRIVIYSCSKNQPDAQYLKFILLWNNTLHVSDGHSVAACYLAATEPV